MLQTIRDPNGDWCRNHRWLEPAICEYPAVLFSTNERQPSPACLLLRFAAFERAGYRPEIRGVYKRLTIWDLIAGIEPREKQNAEPLKKVCPSARELWQWAMAPKNKTWTQEEITCVRKWLGES